MTVTSGDPCHWCCMAPPVRNELTHWGRVTHVCVSKIIIFGSDNGLSPGRRQAIILTNAAILLIGLLGTNLSEFFLSKFKHFHSRKCIWKCRLRNFVCFFRNILCVMFFNVYRADNISANGHHDFTQFDGMLTWAPFTYRKVSNIRRTKSQNLNATRPTLQLSLPNPLKPGVKLRMKM